MHLLIQLTETDKRIIFAIFLLLILIFVIIGYIGYWVTKIMQSQGKKLDTKVYDVVHEFVITDKKTFRKYARKKNWRMFYKSAQIPIILMIIGGISILTYFLITNFKVGLFDDEKGFSTILFLWDFESTPKTDFFGIKIWTNWPPLFPDPKGTPHFEPIAIPSYIGVIVTSIGFLGYLFQIQALIARGLRIRKLSDQVFGKSLEGFNQNEVSRNNANPSYQSPQNNNQNNPTN